MGGTRADGQRAGAPFHAVFIDGETHVLFGPAPGRLIYQQHGISARPVFRPLAAP
jgi:hypothetical protein